MDRLVTTAVTALALLALAAPAGAESGVIVDGSGGDVPTNTDITKVKVDNGETSVGLRVKFTALDPEARARVKVLVDPAPKDTTQYIVESVKRPGRAARTRLLLALGLEFEGTPIACDGVSGAWDYDRAKVTLRVPQSCLTDQGSVAKFRATTLYGDNGGDWTDFLRLRKGSTTTALVD